MPYEYSMVTWRRSGESHVAAIVRGAPELRFEVLTGKFDGRLKMDSRSRAAFLALIVAQAAHSIEEYVFRLFDVLAPARFISGLLSSNLARGFAIANIALVLFGVWCYVARVHHGLPSARGLAWFWALLELGNGIGHSAFALARGGYFPGVATAPLLLGISAYLIARLSAAPVSPVR
jgi:hypothetical protein